jgi:hypothetical protein
MEKIDEALGLFTASCKFRCVDTGFEWAFTGVYGPNANFDRRLFWEEMSSVGSWWEVPWIVGGDFNVVHYASERLGVVSITTTMSNFSDFIDSNGLMDIPMGGGRHTCSNSQSHSRIDRFLFTSSVEDHFNSLVQRRLPWLCSDHFLILLECGHVHWGKNMRPFRFENMWLKSEGFLDRVNGWWDSYSFRGSPSFVVASKLKALKMDLKIWNDEEFGSLDVRKASLLATIKMLDELEDDRPFTESEQTQRDLLKSNFAKTMLMEEICWRQRSQSLWLKEGGQEYEIFPLTSELSSP